MYEELPEGVALPKSVQDIQEVVKQAIQKEATITARSAGTSLAGQATGGGIVLDVSRYMTDIQEIDTVEKSVKVQPGVIRDSVNRMASEFGLMFGPDTSTTNRCMIGGMIGNNSAGSFSIKHKTTREHVKEMEVVLSDGSIAYFGPLSREQLKEKKKLQNLEGHIYRSMIALLEVHREKIINNYPHPEIIRRNTGYALDRLLETEPFTGGGRPFNLCELLCGSEGTLAITTSATLNLVQIAKHQVLVIPQFNTLKEAMLATNEAVKLNPSAVELVDHIILDATKGNFEQSKNRFFLKGEPRYILIIQFEGDSEEELLQKTITLTSILKKKELGNAYPVVSEKERMNRVWELRKAGLGLLMGLGKESRTPAFCEDTSVRVQDLPEYIEDFEQILKKHGTECVFYAHASVGELHLRPVIDTTTESGIDTMKQMAVEIASLVRKYRGSLSGEHGDGRARAPYIANVLGEEMIPVLQQVKEIWDPNYLLNPGKIVLPKPIETDLRFSPSYIKPEAETVFKFRKEESFGDATELCNGAGVCRKLAESGGTMCPSYMATKEEKDSTRGRANVFRQVFSGANPKAFESEELKEALDLCLSCKACKSECPANVDMAKMKAEFMHGWHQRKGTSGSERFFAGAASGYKLASKFPTLSNAVMESKPVKRLLESWAGVDSRRELPSFTKQTFKAWFSNHSSKNDGDQVILFVDVFTNYFEPDLGKSAVLVLENIGFQVKVAENMESGRPQLSKGFLDEAKRIAEDVIRELSAYAEQGIPIIGLEPSEILTLRDEFLDLCDEDQLPQAKILAENSFTFEEFVVNHSDRLPSSDTKKEVVLHGHCHTKALTGNRATEKALKAAGYSVKTLNTGCCGMAGSFGYEKDHYRVSMEIGELVLFPSLRGKKEEVLVCAPGFSCRHQIKDGVNQRAWHPAELIAKTFD
ncbi:MAG: FAD-binding protein [Balneolaceae bacterium]|nr:FAD-binding protein [Balneolaceae bacterium]MBO6547034.1 FAD-binding protein [Balneolaceae bacterium]MBO6648019.1 FAD-binding protein [Balneolaceae bacterium]